jgi:hypothetical protein
MIASLGWATSASGASGCRPRLHGYNESNILSFSILQYLRFVLKLSSKKKFRNHFIMKDFNIHHSSWNDVTTRSNSRSFEMLLMINEFRLQFNLSRETSTYFHFQESESIIDMCLTTKNLNDRILICKYVSKWFGLIRIRIGFCHIGFNPAPVRFFAGSIRFGLGFCRIESGKKEYEEILLISSLSCVANKYIYMHLAYAACAHAKKKFFFVKFIELNCSFSKQFEFCKSDENWAQLLALKLRQMLKLFATQYFDVLDVLASSQAKKK